MGNALPVAAAAVRAGQVVTAYGACLARRSPLCASSTVLPHPAEEIRAAIKLLLPVTPLALRGNLRVGYAELEAFLPESEWEIVRDAVLAYGESGAEGFADADPRDGAVHAVLARMAARRSARIREILAFEDGVHEPRGVRPAEGA